MTNEGNPAQDAVCRAICLGWRLAELYDHKELPGPPLHPEPTELPEHLPGFGDMTHHEKACALLNHVGVDLASLWTALDLSSMPTVKGIRQALDTSGHKRDDVREEIFQLYVTVRDRLAGNNVAAALGFGLGRMLADTALLPTSDDPRILGERFEKYRLANAFTWLGDLDATLPAHSAVAVRASVREWQQWVDCLRGSDGTMKPTEIDPRTIHALRQQGDIWRRLLTGEQAADQLLDGHAYVQAAANLLANARRIVFHFLWKWSWAVVLTMAATAAAIWAAVTFAPAGTDRVAAVLVSTAGFLGLSWAGAQATLGRALRQAEKALWDAEIVTAIQKAATISPKKAKDFPATDHWLTKLLS